jgi:NAD(P) transhydrogenase subunit beta
MRELGDLIEKRGGAVRYAIHPVAGRMPGHMNVLLAEAGVPYDKLIDMDEINERFRETDVAVVVGANDVINPAARTNPASPIFGMPILRVDDAKSVFVLKRGKGKGFSGVENDLFVHPKTSMLFGDARQSLLELGLQVKEA